MPKCPNPSHPRHVSNQRQKPPQRRNLSRTRARFASPVRVCVTMINDHLYEGRFTPRVNGKRISKNVYAKTREECEEKLAELIKTMKAEIAEMKKQAKNA